MSSINNDIYNVSGLQRWYPMRKGSILSGLLGKKEYLKAVDNVSFDIHEGEIVGLAGQSGCGKSTLGELLVDLEKPTDGSINFKGKPIEEYGSKEFRRQSQVIFQDPYESLNPRFTAGRIVAEPLKIHGIGDAEEREVIAMETLADVGLNPPEKFIDKLPGELSGGERQRVNIARALVLDPDFIIADEPVSMLDVSIRVGILNLFKELQEERNFSMLYISHNLETIKYLADRTMIMYLGNIVEIGPTEEVIHNPAHPYSEALIKAVPHPDPDREREGSELEGEVPNPVDLPSGCRFEPQCEYSTEQCVESEPKLMPTEENPDLTAQSGDQVRTVACYHPVNQLGDLPKQGSTE